LGNLTHYRSGCSYERDDLERLARALIASKRSTSMTTRIETEDVVELLPCPFCGLHLREDGTEWHHEIADCPLADCVFDEQQMAEWNTRATPIERLREENARLVERVSDEGGKIIKAFVAGWFEALDLGDMEPAEYQKFRERACGAGVRYLRDLLDPQPNEQTRAAITPSADDDK
jgi:hypothetical protein